MTLVDGEKLCPDTDAFSVLDVGCGSFPEGDVNCDLFVKDVGHRVQAGKSFDAKKIKNFVLCAVDCLPFRKNAFDHVHSRFVIEHVTDPCKVIDEMVRVSDNKVTVMCPFWLGDKLNLNPTHVSFFNKKWFNRYISKRNVFGSVRYSRFKPFLLFLSVPSELTVELRKLVKQ
ncbi:MAG: hypothetical protein CW691_04300 [Candidatus Bathyarchaeum sp.]|nr:MAG: hypothetical protein CW691_04300 [Candidatus Bathyarchaeum sp.]